MKRRGFSAWVDKRAEKIAARRSKRGKINTEMGSDVPVCAESVEYLKSIAELIVHFVEQASRACVGLKDNPLSIGSGAHGKERLL